MSLMNQSKLLPLFSEKKKKNFAGERCLAKHLNESPKLRPLLNYSTLLIKSSNKQANFLKEKKNFRYIINL